MPTFTPSFTDDTISTENLGTTIKRVLSVSDDTVSDEGAAFQQVNAEALTDNTVSDESVSILAGDFVSFEDDTPTSEGLLLNYTRSPSVSGTSQSSLPPLDSSVTVEEQANGTKIVKLHMISITQSVTGSLDRARGDAPAFGSRKEGGGGGRVLDKNSGIYIRRAT